MEGLQVEWETDDGSYGGAAHPGSEWGKYNEQFEKTMRDERAANPNLRQRGSNRAAPGADGLAGANDDHVIDPKRLEELKLRVRARELQKRVESIMNCYYVVMVVRRCSFIIPPRAASVSCSLRSPLIFTGAASQLLPLDQRVRH